MRGSRKITSLARALAPFANRTAGSVVDRIISAAAGAGTFVDANTIHLSGSTILLRHPGAARLAEYPATTEGLQAAVAAAVAGDTVLLPGGVISLPVAAGGTYLPGAEIATGSISSSGTQITGLEIGKLYALESYEGWYKQGSLSPHWLTLLNYSHDGTNWTGWVGSDYDSAGAGWVDTVNTPTFAEYAEVFELPQYSKRHGRIYFRAAYASVWLRPYAFYMWLDPMSWRLREASVEGGSSLLEIPAGVEVVGLGKNTILDGDLVNNGILTNLTVTGAITGAGVLRLVYNAGGEQITDLVGFAAADHNHLLNDLTDVDTSSAVTGDILTYDRLEAPLSAAAKATIIATASHGAATLSNALDGVEDTLQYSSGAVQVAGMFVQFDFGAPVTLTEIEMVCLYGENIHSDYPSAWKISASDTGSFSGEETVVYVGSATMMGRLACPLYAPHEARYWRIALTAGKSNWWRVNEFNFVEVSEMGWSSKPLPDHDHAAGDIDSTGASDGQVLTADGLGGAAWKTPAGGSVAASAVTVDASGFAGNLSAADTDVQTALETLDAMTAGGGSITVEEVDGTPTVAGVNKIKVTNGTLTDDGGGVVTLDFGSAATDGAAIHDNTSAEIQAITEKVTPVGNDLILIEDSADGFAKKSAKLSNLPGGGLTFYWATGYPFKGVSTRTEDSVGIKFLALADIRMTGARCKCDWDAGVTYRLRYWAADGTTILSEADVVGDGETATFKEFTLATPLALSALTEYYITLERVDDGNIKKYYGAGSDHAFLRRTASFSGTPSSQNSATDPYGIMPKGEV